MQFHFIMLLKQMFSIYCLTILSFVLKTYNDYLGAIAITLTVLYTLVKIIKEIKNFKN